MTPSILGPSDLSSLLPPMQPDVHKGMRGSLVLYAGSYQGLGAALLAARAGSASGAGVVSLVLRDELWQAAASNLVSQIVRRESDGPGRKADAILAGPGWGKSEDRMQLLRSLLGSDVPLVLDADALFLAAAIGAQGRTAPLVLSPHPGEFVQLARRACKASEDDVKRRMLSDTLALGQQTACSFGAVLVLKNSVTRVFHPDGRQAVWEGHVPELATGGSGDVLAGLLAGFMARGLSAWDASCAAVIVHGMAGRIAARQLGFFQAQDIIPYAARIARSRNDGSETGI